jgi:phosphoribosylanthranilate isomerase
MAIWVKICGITRLEDALAAVEAGADALGFVFAPSPRRMTPQAVREITLRLPRTVATVGVFVDSPLEDVRRTLAAAGLAMAQLHGAEPPGYVRSLGASAIKALRVADEADVAAADDYDEGTAILLDSAKGGGTGHAFPWSLAAGLAARRKVILAGGLGPSNVAEAVRVVSPWGVDVSSGVESAPGIKDAARIGEFVDAARRTAGGSHSR